MTPQHTTTAAELFRREPSESPYDYFAVHNPQTKGRWDTFVANVRARSKKEALTAARGHGLKLERGATATRIGKEGYFAALKKAFRC